MTQDELNEILEAHKKWLGGEEGGVRAVYEIRYPAYQGEYE